MEINIKKSICFGQNATAAQLIVLIVLNTNAMKWQKHIKIWMFTLANTYLYSCCLVKIKYILLSFLHKAPVAPLQSLS